ncbi:hypothetical protein IPM65_05675 [Candidatus Roizmanbacteria bacterium]|nr:MAG: hypothetical protein IPM65_05675 [Candidatus Roizmanbacteria bacterium]
MSEFIQTEPQLTVADEIELLAGVHLSFLYLSFEVASGQIPYDVLEERLDILESLYARIDESLLNTM